MIDYLPGIGPKSPYRKTQHALLLQRLCAEAWDALRNCPVPQSIVDEVRVASIRSALSILTDEESDVLEKFANLAHCRSALLRLELDPTRYSFTYLEVDLGCSIGVPARHVDHNGRMSVVPTGTPLCSHPIHVHVDVDPGMIDFFRDRDAAQRGYEAEISQIVAVSRGVGAPATWESMLERIPVTRDHFAASLAEPERLAA